MSHKQPLKICFICIFNGWLWFVKTAMRKVPLHRHKRLCGAAPHPGVSQLPTMQLVVCQSGISIVSVFIEAVKQKVLHREWQSRSLNYGAERQQQLWKDGMSSQRGLARRIRSRCSFINVATHEMPRTVPKFISSTELKRGKGPAQVRNCYIAGLGLKTERVFLLHNHGKQRCTPVSVSSDIVYLVLDSFSFLVHFILEHLHRPANLNFLINIRPRCVRVTIWLSIFSVNQSPNNSDTFYTSLTIKCPQPLSSLQQPHFNTTLSSTIVLICHNLQFCFLISTQVSWG